MIKFFDTPQSKDYKSALAWAIGLAVVTYFVFISQHILGNHALRLPWLHQSEQIGNGRWLAPLLGHLHYNADVPVFMPVSSILLCALTAWVSAASWKLCSGKLENFIIFALILIFPMNLAFFYYSFMTPLFFIANLFAVLAVYTLSEFKIWRLLVSAGLVLLMLASYQAAVSLFGIMTFAWAIAHFMRTREEPTTAEVRSQIYLTLSRVAAAAIGGIAYMLSLKFLKISNSQSLELNSFSDVIDRLILVISSSFEHLTATQPDMLEPLKLVLLVMLMAAVVFSVLSLRKSPVRVLIVILLWVGMIISSKAIFLLSDPTGSIFEYRYNAALAFIHAFSFAVVFYALKEWSIARGIVLAVAGYAILTMGQANLVRQDVLMRGQEHDLAIANRILTRIEMLDGFDASQTYDLIRIGRYSTFRYNLFRKSGHKIDHSGDGHMDFGELTDRWVDEDVFRLLGARIKFQQKSTDPQYSAKYAAVRASGLLDGHEVWPAPSSVFIDGDRIIVLMEKPKAPLVPLDVKLSFVEGDTVAARFEPGQWRSLGGSQANVALKTDHIAFSAGESTLSVEAIRVQKGDKITQHFSGEILNEGYNGIPLSFAAGPVFLDKDGKVVGWWDSSAGRAAVESADENGQFSFKRDTIAPAGAHSVHIAFHGPYSPDGKISDGRISISQAKIERSD